MKKSNAFPWQRMNGTRLLLPRAFGLVLGVFYLVLFFGTMILNFSLVSNLEKQVNQQQQQQQQDCHSSSCGTASTTLAVRVSPFFFTSSSASSNTSISRRRNIPFVVSKKRARNETTTTTSSVEQRQPRYTLRMNWTHVPVLSPLAKRIDQTQTQLCRSDAARRLQHHEIHFFAYPMRPSGIGSSLHTWSAVLCHAVQHHMVFLTRGRWDWSGGQVVDESPLRVFFGLHESAAECLLHKNRNSSAFNNVSIEHLQVQVLPFSAPWPKCKLEKLLPNDSLYNKYSKSDYRAAAMEWLFQSVNPIVVQAAQEQIHQAFGQQGLPPAEHMITVNIRWGDKGQEMPLQPMERYIQAVHQLVAQRPTTALPVHVYVASEDPDAIAGFYAAADPTWRVHDSGPTNAVGETVTKANFQTGLQSLAALLLSLESNAYVLTTASNWSRLINELRKNVIDPRCGNCTQMVDLLYDEW